MILHLSIFQGDPVWNWSILWLFLCLYKAVPQTVCLRPPPLLAPRSQNREIQMLDLYFRFLPLGPIWSLSFPSLLLGSCIKPPKILGSRAVWCLLWPPEHFLSYSWLTCQSHLGSVHYPVFLHWLVSKLFLVNVPNCPNLLGFWACLLRSKPHLPVLVFCQRIELALYLCIPVTNGDMDGVYLAFRPPGLEGKKISGFFP